MSSYARRSASPQASRDSQNDKHISHARSRSDDRRRRQGTITDCGRHSNEWLFGGFSFRDTVRDGVDRLRHQRQKS
ncbi:hypothetical protein HFD88_002733 [Aspergillus terreus]|nr:hypothetical protein HFD88_002733 [Aspergillus terreus]